MLQEIEFTIREDFYFIVPALWFIGYACKRTPFIPDWLIVWILISFSVLAAVSMYGFTVQAIADGIIAVAIAVFSHQVVKQTFCKDEIK
ncbi:phage holin family protein [Gracilibacillus marinus]|uniref:Phage holin family protein n=1 Tax=Gracilibacillus marinus TaxID=630535 RepID=A0ABV8VUS1_9BACI